MQNIFEKLANGELSMENPLIHKNSKYKQALSSAGSAEEKLLAVLNDDERIIFEKFTNAHSDIEHYESLYSFTHGFKLGLVMAAEAFTQLQ